MSKYIWGGLSIGAIIGAGMGDDEEISLPEDSNGWGGGKNANNDSDSKNGFEGLFSLWGREIWLYVGGVLGIGNTAGIYFTTGPMIGKNPDWAIGAGVHIMKGFGIGMVIPIYHAFKSYQKHEDKIAAYIDIGKQQVDAIKYNAHQALEVVSPLTEGLESLL